MNRVSELPAASGSPPAGFGQQDAPTVDERPISEIVGDLWRNTEKLIRQELQLGLADAEQRARQFKAELSTDVDQLKQDLMLKAIGGVVALLGLMTLTAALVLLLAEALSPWLSALIVGLVIAAGGGALLLRSPRKQELPDARGVIPTRAAQSVKEDIKTVQEAMK